MFVVLGSCAVADGAAPLLRRDPTPESLSTLAGILLETPRSGCTKWDDFEASLQTDAGTIDMTLPCYDGVERRAIGQTLTVRYAKGTNFVGLPYQVVWEMQTPARVYLDFARRQHDQNKSRLTGAFEVLGGLVFILFTLQPRLLRRFLAT